MKKENFGDFKSPFGSLHPSLTATSTMPSIMSPFFTSLAAQANVTGSSKLFSPSEIFGSLESSKAATSAGSASSVTRPSPPSSPLKPTAFNFNSLSHGIIIFADQLFFNEYFILLSSTYFNLLRNFLIDSWRWFSKRFIRTHQFTICACTFLASIFCSSVCFVASYGTFSSPSTNHRWIDFTATSAKRYNATSNSFCFPFSSQRLCIVTLSPPCCRRSTTRVSSNVFKSFSSQVVK